MSTLKKDDKCLHNGEVWTVKEVFHNASISNGTDQLMIQRDRDELITVKSAGECCEIVESGEGKFLIESQPEGGNRGA